MNANPSDQSLNRAPAIQEGSEISASSSATIDPNDPNASRSQTEAPKGARGKLGGLLHTLGQTDFIGVLVATIGLTIVIGLAHPDFLAPAQLLDILNQASFVAVLACGMAFLIAMRELDLSVGSIYGLTSLCAAMLMHNGTPSWLGAIVGILIGAALGLVNGLLIQLFRLPSIVATLATMSIFRGLIYALSDGKQVIGLSLTDPFSNFIGGSTLGIPTNVWVMVIVVAIFIILLRSTPYGYRVRSMGSNPEAAEYSGLPIKRVRLWAFILMGTLGGVAGMLSLGYFGSSDPNLGTGYELLAIAAVVIGGTPLRGGKATIVGSALGAVLLGVVGSGLAYFNVPINWSTFATGSVILLAVSLDSLLRRNRTERARRL